MKNPVTIVVVPKDRMASQWSIRTESQSLRMESQSLRTELQSLRTKSQSLRTEWHHSSDSQGIAAVPKNKMALHGIAVGL